MDIKFNEIKNKNLNVDEIKMSADKLINKRGKSVSYPLMQTSYIYLIVGPSGSGKTNLLINLLKKKKRGVDGSHTSYHGMYDNIVVVSPSLHTIKNNIFDTIDNNKIFKSLTTEVFDKVDDLISDDEHTLLILDDVSSQLKNKDILQDLNIYQKNRRHKNLSIIIILHKLVDAPTTIRNNANLIFLFRPKNKKEIEFIYDEFLTIPRNDYLNMLDFIFKSKHDFMIIDQSMRQGSKFEFFRNFNLIEF